MTGLQGEAKNNEEQAQVTRGFEWWTGPPQKGKPWS